MLPEYEYQQRNNYYKNMADINKPKLQLRPGLSINGDKTPSPATKLLINHGKPNFTIQRSPKALNGNSNPLSPTPKTPTTTIATTSDEFIVKSTKFNGVFQPSNISAATKEVLKQNGLTNTNGYADNEATKVVLRRTKVIQPELREGENENVPEFILRQRRIQERLANQNILDFENRRSGYFTQVMISPSSPNRQSFVETMSSPAVKPGLEIPPSAQEREEDEENNNNKAEETEDKLKEEESENVENVKSEEPVLNVQAEPVTVNGQIEEEEVNKAIEEVNKAVEGEDDDKTEEEPNQAQTEQIVEALEEVVAAAENELKAEEKAPQEETTKAKDVIEIATEVVTSVVTSALEVAQDEVKQTIEEPKTNGTLNELPQHKTDHHTNGEVSENEITISHTNGLNGPSLPSPDPAGEKGVNFEPKTVVSFSQELGNDVNKYPDSVKVLRDAETSDIDSSELKELTKLKFEIKADDKDIEVKPVLITEEVNAK